MTELSGAGTNGQDAFGGVECASDFLPTYGGMGRRALLWSTWAAGADVPAAVIVGRVGNFLGYLPDSERGHLVARHVQTLVAALVADVDVPARVAGEAAWRAAWLADLPALDGEVRKDAPSIAAAIVRTTKASPREATKAALAVAKGDAWHVLRCAVSAEREREEDGAEAVAAEQAESDHYRRLRRAHEGAKALVSELPEGADFPAALAARFDLAPVDAELVARITVEGLIASEAFEDPEYDPSDPFSGSPPDPVTTAARLRAKALQAQGQYLPPAEPACPSEPNPVREVELEPRRDAGLNRGRSDSDPDHRTPAASATKAMTLPLPSGSLGEINPIERGMRPLTPTPFVWREPETIPRRQWLYGSHLIRGEISLTLSPGGVGKTSLAAAETAAMVSGRPLLHDAPTQRLRVWWWNGEEPEDEMHRRIAAVAKHYGLTPDDFGDRLFLDNGHDMPLLVAEEGKDGVRVLTPVIDRLVEALRERCIDVMLVDPFVSTHNVSENANGSIPRAATAWKTVAHRAGAAIGLAHHTRKLAGREATAEDSRGGDALVAKVRDARTLNPMSAEDAARVGIHATERQSFFFTGPGGKSNMAPKTGCKRWHRLVSVGLGNSASLREPEDAVGVVTAWTPPRAQDGIDAAAVRRLVGVMAGRQWRGAPQSWKRDDWIGRAVAEAFALGFDDGFEVRAKPLIAALESMGVLVREQATGPRREAISIMRAGNVAAYMEADDEA